MSAKIERGMILAAGLGTRLLPITGKVPKPLVPVLNLPNILYSLDLLKRAGVTDVIVNVHHLADQMEAYLGDGSRWGLRVAFSREPVLLGTGGGVKKAERFFGGKPFLLTNSDFITDVELAPFVERHFRRRGLATMVLFEDPMMAGFYSRVGADPEGRLCSLPSLEVRPPARTGIFSGIHVLDTAPLRYLQEVPSGINQVLYPAAMKQTPERVFCDFMEGSYWYDTGDIYFLWLTSMRLLERLWSGKPDVPRWLTEYGGYRELKSGVWAPKGEKLPRDCEIFAPLVLGRGVRAAKGAILGPFAVIGDDSEVGSDTRLSRFVALPGSRVADGTRMEGGLQFEGELLPTKKGSRG